MTIQFHIDADYSTNRVVVKVLLRHLTGEAHQKADVSKTCLLIVGSA